MCRWAAWTGEPILLEELLSAPSNSLINQSRHACKAKTDVNADGFGVAWYGDQPFPGQYRDILPAWSDANLRSMAQHICSPLFLAHVRASTGTALSRENAHPFVHENWSFMHNGQVPGYAKVRQQIEGMIAPEHYASRQGSTDSEALFLLALGQGIEHDPLGAMARVVQMVSPLCGAGLRMTAAFSDGKRLFAVRYTNDAIAPSLFVRRNRQGWSVVSEPLDVEGEIWHEVPAGHAIVCDGTTLTQHPFCASSLRAA
ncbi:glutamine amidotransferase [Monaibacterium marinum]|uniref:Glutamine amidotransferase n=1 Tax=Pontivivens marinum TaxID=1690039 RepID=A0A2C9CQC8_9RHOB|nr:class II glutamine amidotransferase [Monaibacterium marinum]SOH93556.1 glutamine amidotransferase [Monaibacterium marinum]